MAALDVPDLGVFLKKALKQADQAELFFESGREMLFKSTLDKIESSEASLGSGFSIRVVKDGRLGFAFFTNPREFDAALKSAVRSAKFSEKLGVIFASKQKAPGVAGIFDKKLSQKTAGELAAEVVDMIDAVKNNFAAAPTQNFLSSSEIHYALASSEGSRFEARTTAMEISSVAQYKESKSFDSKSATSFFSGAPLACNAAFFAELFAGAKPVTGTSQVILHPRVISQLLAAIFLPAIDGERVFRKKSFLCGKLGQRIANEDITILDDPLLPNAIGSCSYDDEGTPTRTKPIIERGTLQTFLYDLESARRAGKKPTGNGFKDSFTDKPGAENASITANTKNKTSLSETTGILVRDVLAVHNANPVTGDFALEISEGCEWNAGNGFGKPVRACSVVGNFFQILKNTALADDFQNAGFYYGPSWIFKAKIV